MERAYSYGEGIPLWRGPTAIYIERAYYSYGEGIQPYSHREGI
jgi:hypothetical protein